MSTSHIKIALDRITVHALRRQVTSTLRQNLAALTQPQPLKLVITTLETRRMMGDLVEAFKIIKGFSHVDYSDLFTVTSTNLRGHSMKLFKTHFVCKCGKFVYANRLLMNGIY